MQRWAMIMLFILASGVEAGELPSEVDLRAAYCLPIVRRWIDEVTSWEHEEKNPAQRAVIADGLVQKRTDLRRLRLYLSTRIEHLDSLGLIVASKRGKEDLVTFDKSYNTCGAQCDHLLRKHSSSEWHACMDTCTADNPVFTRVKPCTDLTWLPF